MEGLGGRPEVGIRGRPDRKWGYQISRWWWVNFSSAIESSNAEITKKCSLDWMALS